MTNQEKLTEAFIKLSEDFRDYDEDIDKLEDELYDLIYSIDTNIRWDDIYDYVCDEEMCYEDDIERIKELQAQIKDLQIKREQEYNEEIKDLPPRTTKTDFEGFDITKTDPPYDSYFLEGSKDRDYLLKKYGYIDAYISEMTPDEYLLLCGKYGWKDRFTDVDTIYNTSGTDKEKVKEYAEMFRNGEKAPMPVIDVKNIGQEGRHRAFAAKEVGMKTIPVLIKF